MRKLLCLLMAILLIGTVALAESIDLSALSDDELLALKDQLDSVIYERELFSSTLFPAGLYVVGEDIKAGKYAVHVGNADIVGHIRLYANKEDLESRDESFDLTIYPGSVQHFFVSLEDHQIMEFSFAGTASIEKMAMIE